MDFDKITEEITPFLVDNRITQKTEQKWLESKGVIRMEGKQLIIIADKDTDKTSCKNYEKHCKYLELYLKERNNRKLGKMGTNTKNTEDTEKVLTNEINGNEIPF